MGVCSGAGVGGALVRLGRGELQVDLRSSSFIVGVHVLLQQAGTEPTILPEWITCRWLDDDRENDPTSRVPPTVTTYSLHPTISVVLCSQ
jgi:hypothetical protein